MNRKHKPGAKLASVGLSVLRCGLVANILWIGALKFESYEVENIEPLIASSPLFSQLHGKLGAPKLARLIGGTEIAIGSLIAAKPLAPKLSAVGSLGAVGMFLTTLSFLATTPELWEENKVPKLSANGQFVVKDIVLLGASFLTAADSLRAAADHPR